MNLKAWFWPQIIFSTLSPYNKKIEVREFFGARSLRVNNVTQSGGIVEDIYKKAIQGILSIRHSGPSVLSSGSKDLSRIRFWSRRFAPPQNDVRHILILGFGAGSFAKLVNKKYPLAKIIGVEIDEVIIETAKKYFAIDKINNLKIITTDGFNFIKTNKKRFDLIFVDLYFGEKNSMTQRENKNFLNNLKKSLCSGDNIIFNLINFKKYKEKNENFLKTLSDFFPAVTSKKAYSNLIVYCTL